METGDVYSHRPQGGSRGRFTVTPTRPVDAFVVGHAYRRCAHNAARVSAASAPDRHTPRREQAGRSGEFGNVLIPQCPARGRRALHGIPNFGWDRSRNCSRFPTIWVLRGLKPVPLGLSMARGLWLVGLACRLVVPVRVWAPLLRFLSRIRMLAWGRRAPGRGIPRQSRHPRRAPHVRPAELRIETTPVATGVGTLNQTVGGGPPITPRRQGGASSREPEESLSQRNASTCVSTHRSKE